MSQETEPLLKCLPNNLGTPRLIDIDHYSNFTIEICRAIKIEDLVATVLHNYQSELLDKFFSDNPFEFRNVFDGGGEKDFGIQKNADNTVKVGWLTKRTSDWALCFEYEIDKSGRWNAKGEEHEDQEVASFIQTIFDRPPWLSGNTEIGSGVEKKTNLLNWRRDGILRRTGT